MFLGDIIYAAKILERPDAMDRVEDPYVVVMASMGWVGPQNKDVIKVMTLMHARGWETLNVSFLSPGGAMFALLKNPRTKSKNVEES